MVSNLFFSGLVFLINYFWFYLIIFFIFLDLIIFFDFYTHQPIDSIIFIYLIIEIEAQVIP
jgi:hypothetical protein